MVVGANPTGYSKTITPSEAVGWCPASCGPGCWTNAGASETFDVTVTNGQVTAVRTDVQAPWASDLSFFCCKPPGQSPRSLKWMGGWGVVLPRPNGAKETCDTFLWGNHFFVFLKSQIRK